MKERSDKVVPEDAIHLFFSATDKERYIYRHCIDDGPLNLDRAHGPFELFFGEPRPNLVWACPDSPLLT
jgi:hypothetical protein